MWLKQKDGTFIKQETTQVVDLKEFLKRKDKLLKKIKELESEKIDIEKIKNNKLREASRLYNERVNEEINMLSGEIADLDYQITEVKNGNKD